MKKQLLLLAMMLLPMVASADAVEIGGIWYKLDLTIKQAEVTEKPSGKYSGAIVIPEKVTYDGTEYRVTSIDGYAFCACSGLTSITIGNNVTSIGFQAFYHCSALTSVTIGNSVTSIGGSAFSGCSGLTSITIPNSMTSIGNSAFSNCGGLTSITIGNSVTSIGDGAFDGCYSLTSVHISDIGAWCKISFNATSSNPLSRAHHLYMNGSEIINLVIPDGVTSIGERAFYECYSLTSVTIPGSVTSIGDFAFHDCTGLTSVTIGNSVTSIGEHAFSYCSGLTSITIPGNVTSIGNLAFGNIDFAEIVSLIETPFEINSNTFSRNTHDNATLYVPKGTLEKYKSTAGWKDFSFIEEGDGSGENADASGTCGANLTWTYVEATKTLTISGEGAMTDYDGDNFAPWYIYIGEIASAILEPGVTTIGNYAFYGCSGLTSITIPDGVTSIGGYAFYGCSGLNTVIVLAETPPSLYNNSFSNYDITLKVPETALETYASTSPWSNFTTIQSLTGEAYEKKIEKPEINVVDGKLVFSCATEGVEYNWSITTSNGSSGKGNNIPFTQSFTVSVYATKAGWENSDVTTKVFSGSGLAGDANGDEVINVADVVSLINMIMNQE